MIEPVQQQCSNTNVVCTEPDHLVACLNLDGIVIIKGRNTTIVGNKNDLSFACMLPRIIENEGNQMGLDTLLDYMIWLNNLLEFHSIEFPDRKASGSELRRWIKNGAIEINGACPRDFGHALEYPIQSLVLFPKGKRRTTLI